VRDTVRLLRVFARGTCCFLGFKAYLYVPRTHVEYFTML
jgi:hypothetical protein